MSFGRRVVFIVGAGGFGLLVTIALIGHRNPMEPILDSTQQPEIAELRDSSVESADFVAPPNSDEILPVQGIEEADSIADTEVDRDMRESESLEQAIPRDSVSDNGFIFVDFEQEFANERRDPE